jgi:hypothetical protein
MSAKGPQMSAEIAVTRMSIIIDGSASQAAPDMEFGYLMRPDIGVKMLSYAQIFTPTRIFGEAAVA